MQVRREFLWSVEKKEGGTCNFPFLSYVLFAEEMRKSGLSFWTNECIINK